MPEPNIPDTQPFTPGAGDEDQAQVTVTDERIQALAAKSGDTVEHVKEMLGLAGESVAKEPDTDATAATNGEQKLAGKFNTEADLQKGLDNITKKLGVDEADVAKKVEELGAEEAYKHFESQIGTGTDGDALSKEDDALTKDQDGAEGSDAEGESTTEKLDVAAMNQEFLENGELSDDSYQKLADAGFDRAIVDSFIDGQTAKAELFQMKVYNMVGGQDSYDTLVQWGAQNLTTAEKTRFDAAISAGDLDTIQTYVDALQARYTKANGTMNRKGIKPSDSITTTSAGGYGSQQEYLADLKDPRYLKGDMAFHRQVMAKLKNSKF